VVVLLAALVLGTALVMLGWTGVRDVGLCIRLRGE